MAFVKDRKAEELRLAVRAHAVAIMNNGFTREKAIEETRSKFSLDNDYLEGVVPKFSNLPTIEPEKKKAPLFTKPDGTTYQDKK